MPDTAPKVLVTGVTSLVGSAVALEFARAGFKLRGTSRSQQRADEWSAKYPQVDIEWKIIGDHTEPGVYDDAVADCDKVCHSAGPYTLTHKVRPPTPSLLCCPFQDTSNTISRVADQKF